MAATIGSRLVDDVLRRRSVGAPAARSTLLTVLGEYLLPRPDGAWEEALIAALRLRRAPAPAPRCAVARRGGGGGARGCGGRRPGPSCCATAPAGSTASASRRPGTA